MVLWSWVRGVGALLLGTLVVACAAEDAPGGEETEGCVTGDPCAINSDCDDGERCNGDVCTRLYCLEKGAACEVNEVCVSRECTSGTSGQVCWVGPRPLGFGCSGAGECESGLVCLLGRCGRLGSVPEGGSCTMDMHCGPGLFCSSSLCNEEGQVCTGPLAQGELCCSAEQCADGPLCRPRSCFDPHPECAPVARRDESCCADADCESPLTCIYGLCQSDQPPDLQVVPTSIEWAMVVGGPNPSGILTIMNNGTAATEVVIYTNEYWMAVEPTSGSIEPMGTLDVRVDATSEFLAPQVFMAPLIVGTNPPTVTIQVPVTLTVTAP